MAVSRIKTSSVLQGFPKSRSLLAGNAPYIPTDFESIQTATGNGSSSTITFSSIPSTYKHLQIRSLYISTAGSNDRQNMLVKFNSDTTSTLPAHFLRGRSDGVAGYSDFRSSGNFVLWYSGYSSPSQSYLIGGVSIIDIHDYTSTIKNKTVRSFTGADDNNSVSGGSGIVLDSALWESTSAINSITLTSPSGNFATGSVFSLYGIKG